MGFSTRHLCCLVCIRLTEPRLLGQPRAVRLDKNNCKEGQEDGLSEAAQPCKVTQWVEGLRSCSPRIPCSWLCSEAISLPSSNPGHFPLTEGTNGPVTVPVEEQTPDTFVAEAELTFSRTSVPDLMLKCRNTSVPFSKYLFLSVAAATTVALSPDPVLGKRLTDPRPAGNSFFGAYSTLVIKYLECHS